MQIFLILILAAIFLIIVAALIFLVVKIKHSNKTTQNVPATKREKEITLQDLIDMASNPKSDKNDLFAALNFHRLI